MKLIPQAQTAWLLSLRNQRMRGFGSTVVLWTLEVLLLTNIAFFPHSVFIQGILFLDHVTSRLLKEDCSTVLVL